MPSPKRYFHKSRDFYDDPETWELIEKHGPKAVFVWDLILSALDVHDNELQLGKTAVDILARKLKMRAGSVQLIVSWMLARRWLEANQQLTVNGLETYHAPNHWKYYKRPERTGDRERLPPILSSPIPLSLRDNSKNNSSLSLNLKRETPVDNSNLNGRTDLESIILNLAQSKGMPDA